MSKLGDTFQKIMEDYGHDVLVIHNAKDEICSCYDYLTGSVKRDCSYCFGTGHVPEIKKYRTRYLEAKVPESNVFMLNPQGFGEIAISSKTYFFYKDKNLRVGDLIMEVDWDGFIPIYNRGGIYQVAHIEELRYLNGDVLYYKVYVKDQPIRKSIRGIRVVKKGKEIYYELAEGRGHQIKDPDPKQRPHIPDDFLTEED